jgi:hypothetical protein
MEKGTSVRDCRKKPRMGVMCKVAIIDYFVSGYCGGDKDSGGKGGEEGKIKKEKE